MNILLVHPGASVSTHDVWVGLSAALSRRGHTVWDYALDSRIEMAGAWMTYVWRRVTKRQPNHGFTKPGPADILYKAGEELVARALRVQPDVVLVVSAMFLHPDVILLLRRAGLRIAVLFTESPYDDERQSRLLPYVDVAWTNERSSARAMRIGYLPHALNADIHHTRARMSDAFPAHDVVFVGTGFKERIDTLAAVDWAGIDLGLYGSWSLLGPRHRLRQYIRGGYVDNADVSGYYRAATIGLNLYRTSKGFGRHVPQITGAESLNPRAYELAALGCFTVSEARPEVTERFHELVPTFTDPTQLRGILDRWLGDDVGRARIQAQLPACVASETWDQRVHTIEADLTAAGIGAASQPPAAAASVAVGGT